MFQREVDSIFKDLPDVFGIPDDILVVGYDKDGKDMMRLFESATKMQTGKPQIK